jgi:hypothetical protein
MCGLEEDCPPVCAMCNHPFLRLVFLCGVLVYIIAPQLWRLRSYPSAQPQQWRKHTSRPQPPISTHPPSWPQDPGRSLEKRLPSLCSCHAPSAGACQVDDATASSRQCCGCRRRLMDGWVLRPCGTHQPSSSSRRGAITASWDGPDLHVVCRDGPAP